MQRWRGSILVLLSAISFGFMPLFGSFARDVSLPVMLMLRFAIAAAVLGGASVATRQPFPRGRLLLILLVMGALGYFGEAYLYFSALQHAPSGMVSLLLYTYPAIVTILSVTILKERLTRARLLALVLAIAGSALTAIPGLLGPAHQRIQPLGVVLGLGCSASYAIYILVGARLPKTARPLPSAVLVCAGASFMFGIMALGRAGQNPVLPQSASAWGGIVGLAVICTVIGVTAFLAGLARVGPIRASTLSAFEPVVTATIGVLALNEEFSPMQIVGGGLIVGAAILSAQAQDGGTRAPAATPLGATSSTS